MEIKTLFSYKVLQNKLHIKKIQEPSQLQKMPLQPIWAVVNSTRKKKHERSIKYKQGYKLYKGDYAKLGNSLLRFIEVVGQNVQPLIKKNSNISDQLLTERQLSVRQRTVKKDLVCRVCLCDDFTSQNPLIAPCQVHLLFSAPGQ